MRKHWKQWLNLFGGGGSKITADGDFSHENKRWLLLGWKVVTNLDSILKSRDITLPTKVRLAKAMVFPVVVYGCKRWTIRKAECWRIDVFELWCWRRLLRAPWTARTSNQSILKEIILEHSLEGLKLKHHYFGTDWRWSSITLAPDAKSLLIGKNPDTGKDWRQEKKGATGWDGWMASLNQWPWCRGISETMIGTMGSGH